jgi:sterol desaturase/sphingolipid hydroxylase (fatty acid hydroxylase superfamily)
MNQFQVIVLATPLFFVLIGLEFALGHWRERRGTGRNTYRFNDTLNSISLGVLSQLGGLFSQLLTLGIYTAIYTSFAFWSAPDFWQSGVGFLVALVFYDFCYYWLHRAGHRSTILWAAHGVHHQSQCYNLSTALRQTSSGPLLSWVFYVPMALAGVPPLVFGIVALIDLLYQFWVHTEQVGKLGWFDRVFCSPSNHRVHHAVNDDYLDKNYGGILIVWDRLFGTFQEENETCVYGTRSPLASWDPLWANAQIYASLLKDAWHAKYWLDKARVLLKPPGWRPAELEARFPTAPFVLAALRTYDPHVSRATQWAAAGLFMALLQGVTFLLWFADRLPTSQLALGSALLMAGFWCVGALLQGRFSRTN